jgi:hypothetical protein
VRSYSESNVFSPEETRLLRTASWVVGHVSARGPEVRCHELSRAVGLVLELPVQDGYYGFVDHSWLWTRPLDPSRPRNLTRLGFPNILDVYSVGQLPQVRLVGCEHPQLPHVGWAYRPGEERFDIDAGLVDVLAEAMRSWLRPSSRSAAR